MTLNGQPIKSGIFIMPFHPPDKPLAQCYEEDVELAVRAEELGFDEFWIGEHHTMKYETVVVPEVFIGRILGETQRIRSARRQSAPTCIIPPIWPAASPFSTTSRMGGSISASGPAP